MNHSTALAASAAIKMANGALMTLDEVAARLAVAPQTVHRLPLPSIRLGRSLRFDPRDVAALVAISREAIALPLGASKTEVATTN